MGGVLTDGREACVACGPNFKPLARLVAEISVEKLFPIVTVCWGPTIGFRYKPAVRPKWHNLNQLMTKIKQRSTDPYYTKPSCFPIEVFSLWIFNCHTLWLTSWITSTSPFSILFFISNLPLDEQPQDLIWSSVRCFTLIWKEGRSNFLLVV